MIRFELDSAASMVRARQQRPMPDVKNGNAIATSVADNYISPFIAAFKIEAYSPDSTAVVIKVNDIFNGKNTSFNNVFSDINIGGSAISDLSRIKSIKAFSNNVYAVSEPDHKSGGTDRNGIRDRRSWIHNTSPSRESNGATLGKPAYRIFLRVSAKLLRCSAARADTKLHHTLETGTEKG